MTEYTYVHEMFHFEDGETIDVPDAAIGVTVQSFGTLTGGGTVATVRYLLPADHEDAPDHE